jgi:hypothetical protein
LEIFIRFSKALFLTGYREKATKSSGISHARIWNRYLDPSGPEAATRASGETGVDDKDEVSDDPISLNLVGTNVKAPDSQFTVFILTHHYAKCIFTNRLIVFIFTILRVGI